MVGRRITAGGLIALLALSVQSKEPVNTEKMDDAQPSLALLEFLGSFETPQGEFVDPLSLVDKSKEQQHPSLNKNEALLEHKEEGQQLEKSDEN